MMDLKISPTETRTVAVRISQGASSGNEAGQGMLGVPLARAPLPQLSCDVAIRDLDDLLVAVKAKLRQTIGELPVNALDSQDHDAAARVGANVLECVAALDQLHTTLMHELDRGRQIELQLFDARTELARAQAELLGTQAGERRARHLALHDGLTLLPNRTFFRERLDNALEHENPLARAFTVLYLDLDGFKRVNDSHGHDAGDELLRIVAARLSRSVRAGDVVSRIGGDEFACLLAGVPERDQLCSLARKLFLAVSAPFKIGTLQLTVRPSIGIATSPADGDTSDLLFKRADVAMYRAKRHQTGYAFFRDVARGGEAPEADPLRAAQTR